MTNLAIQGQTGDTTGSPGFTVELAPGASCGKILKPIDKNESFNLAFGHKHGLKD